MPKSDAAETLTFWFKCPELGILDSAGGGSEELESKV